MPQIDPKKLGTWFEEHTPRLVLYARQWLGHEAAADAVQDAFIQLMKQKQEPPNVRAWLFKTVRNRTISQMRSQARRKKRERTAGQSRSCFESRTDDLLDAKAISEMLQDLEPESREIIVLRIWGQMTLQQIGQIVDLSPTTVFRRYEQGLKTIRQALETSHAQAREK
jgi:RNA polymerase sigma-70 factor (ECF subfamily)